jgi:hypothetical protein
MLRVGALLLELLPPNVSFMKGLEHLQLFKHLQVYCEARS